MLWVVLANVNEGDWTKQTPEWQEAAKRWRDNYFGAVAKKDHSELDQLNKFMTHNTREQGIEEIEEHEMTDFERELAQAILGSLEYRGFYDCGKYLDTSLIEHIRPLLHQELQKARADSYVEGYVDGIGVSGLNMPEDKKDELRQTIIDRYSSELDQPINNDKTNGL